MPCLGVWILPCRKQAPLASFHFFTFQASDEHLCWPFRGVSAPLVSGPLHERLSRGLARLWTSRILRQGRHLLEADSSQLTGALRFPDPRLNSPVPLDCTPEQLRTLRTPSGTWLQGSGALPQWDVCQRHLLKPEIKTSWCRCVPLPSLLFKTTLAAVSQGRHYDP